MNQEVKYVSVTIWIVGDHKLLEKKTMQTYPQDWKKPFKKQMLSDFSKLLDRLDIHNEEEK